MVYRSGIFLLYGAVHTFICLLHFYMGKLDRMQGDKIRQDQGIGRAKVVIFSIIVFVLALTAFIMLLLENKGVASYDDEDDARIEEFLSSQWQSSSRP